jgi:hypothetical protein
MATLQVCLPDDLLDFVEIRRCEGHFETAGDYLCSLLREDRQRAVREAQTGHARGLGRVWRSVSPDGTTVTYSWTEPPEGGTERK